MSLVKRSAWLKTAVWAVAGLLVLLGLVAFTNMYWRQQNEPDYSNAAGITKGMDEDEVRVRLGEPWRTYERANAPSNYFIEGYSHPNRAITGKVMIYFGGSDMIVYVYVDEDGRVEEKFIGGS